MLLTSNKYSIICLVETYLNVSDVDALILFNVKGYTLFRLDRQIHAEEYVYYVKIF